MKDVLILKELLSAQDDYVSGSRLAETLGISRVAIWSHMEKLRTQGFDFEAIRSKGYRLIKRPAALSESLLLASMPRAASQLKLVLLDETDSTNSEAERMLANGEEAPFLVLARRQSKGRGRLGRQWHSPDNGNLYASYAFRPDVSPARLSTFTLWMGINICECVNAFFRVQSNIKWPNDIHIGGRKVAGILTEARMDADQTRDLVLGIGLNINGDGNDWPEELKAIATSVRQETGRKQDANHFAAALSGRVILAYEQFVNDTYRNRLRERWSSYDALEGRQVSLFQGSARVQGVARGIDPHGALIVERDDGSRIQVRAGEVTLEK
ncbi:MAG: biotin--[acetyl-CoA-carboxylase] ligase [Opitutales bacterium TMED158]|nr:MAG: biotin--[acetyl-CoA-carboxylase] ligase [Opitutales bacterium TMED158]